MSLDLDALTVIPSSVNKRKVCRTLLQKNCRSWSVSSSHCSKVSSANSVTHLLAHCALVRSCSRVKCPVKAAKSNGDRTHPCRTPFSIVKVPACFWCRMLYLHCSWTSKTAQQREAGTPAVRSDSASDALGRASNARLRSRLSAAPPTHFGRDSPLRWE